MNMVERIARLFAVVAMVAGFFLGMAKHQMLWAGVCFLSSGLLQILAGGHFTGGILFGLFVICSSFNNRILFWIAGGVMAPVAIYELVYYARRMFAIFKKETEGTKQEFFFWQTDISVRIWKKLIAEKDSGAA